MQLLYNDVNLMDKFDGNKNTCDCAALDTFVKYIKACLHKQIAQAIKIIYRMTGDTKKQEMMHKLWGNCLSTFTLPIALCWKLCLFVWNNSSNSWQCSLLKPSHETAGFEKVKNALIILLLPLTLFEERGRKLLTHFLAWKIFHSSMFWTTRRDQ